MAALEEVGLRQEAEAGKLQEARDIHEEFAPEIVVQFRD